MTQIHADLVIIGNGMAAARLVQELKKQPGFDGSILMIGREPRPAYNRVLLSSLLAGEVQDEALELHSAQWYREQGIELLCQDPVVTLEPEQHRLQTLGGKSVHYRQLVFATGSNAYMPPLPGINLNGVMGFRNWQDVEIMRETAVRGGRALVIGGGLLGLEAAEGLRKQGMSTTVLQRSGYLLNRQLDRHAAGLLRETLEARGLQIITGAGIEALQGNAEGWVTGVILKDGRCLPADLVVVATGITPEISLARAAHLECDRAITVDGELRTSAQDIFALGECCQFEGHTYGLVAPIWRQARVLARVLQGEPDRYCEQPVATQLKISGISLFSCGEIDAPDADILEYQDPELGDYCKLWSRGVKLVGAVLYGDTGMGNQYFEQLTQDAAP